MEKSVIKFSAEGMRELTYNAQHSLENEEFQNTKEKIMAAAKQGRYSLNLTLDYSTTIKALQALGFKVHYTDIPITTYTSGKVPKYYEVSWLDK
jgi:hypothetical protein